MSSHFEWQLARLNVEVTHPDEQGEREVVQLQRWPENAVVSGKSPLKRPDTLLTSINFTIQNQEDVKERTRGQLRRILV